VANNALPSVQLLGELRYFTASVRRADGFMAVCNTPECVNVYRTRREKFISGYKSALAAYEPLICYPGEREMYTTFRDGMATYLGYSEEYVKLIDAGKIQEARDFIIGGKVLAQF